MKTTIALIIKLLVTYLAAWISFTLINNVILTDVLIISGLGTILNFFIGDLFLLRRFGNTVTSVTNGVITAATAYIILTITNYGGTASILIFAAMVVMIEFFFHMYLYKANIIRKKTSGNVMARAMKLNYSTEVAKEMNPDRNTLRARRGDR
jgi:hypothetical protein